MRSEKPKLLVVTTTFPRWTQDTDPPFIYELARRLTGHFDIVVHTPSYQGALQRERLSGLVVHRFRYFFARFEKLAGETAILPFLQANKGYWLVLPFFLLAQLGSLFLLVQRERPDVIHAHWLIPTGLLALIARGGRRIPVVVTGHGADVFGLQARIFLAAKKMVLQQVESCTVVSHALKKKLSALVPAEKPVVVLPMGVDSLIFNGQCPEAKDEDASAVNGTLLLFVGRLSEKKGVCFLLDAFAVVHRKYPSARLLIVGDGEERLRLMEQTRILGIEKFVDFCGALPNAQLPEKYAMADIFIGPSVVATGGDAEGFGLTFIEASFSGCFLIGSNTGGIGDIIVHNETGLLTIPENSADLAEKISWAIEHPQEVARIKNNALCVHKKNYDWAVIAGQYARIINNSLYCRKIFRP